jgi:hypothetical protein
MRKKWKTVVAVTISACMAMPTNVAFATEENKGAMEQVETPYDAAEISEVNEEVAVPENSE